MNTAMTLALNSASSKDTVQLGEQLGKRLKGGEVIELVGDLGSGKTTFVKGLARGAGSSSTATSPSFVLSKIYPCPKFEICHYDLYRLNEPGVVALELGEDIGDSQKVLVIEWGQSVRDALPPQRVVISFGHKGADKRKIEITYPEKLAYLLEGIK